MTALVKPDVSIRNASPANRDRFRSFVSMFQKSAVSERGANAAEKKVLLSSRKLSSCPYGRDALSAIPSWRCGGHEPASGFLRIA